MGTKKDIKIILDTYGNYLGMEKGCIILRDKKRNETRYPLIENSVGEIVLNSGNMVSTGLLTYLGFWGIDVLVSTRYGRPIAVLKDLDDDMHVETRVSQYRALKNGKGCYLAKKLVEGKMKGQNSLLAKYGLETDDSYIKKVKASKETKLIFNLKELLVFVMELAKKSMSVQRYKGLGEMNPDQLWITTMDPDKRTVQKVTVEDAVEADAMFTVLMGDQVEPRRQFIEKYAPEVKVLDV